MRRAGRHEAEAVPAPTSPRTPYTPQVTVDVPQQGGNDDRKLWIAGTVVGTGGLFALCWQIGARLPMWPVAVLSVAVAAGVLTVAFGWAYPRVRVARHPVAPMVIPEYYGVDGVSGDTTYRLHAAGQIPAPSLEAATDMPARRALPQ